MTAMIEALKQFYRAAHNFITHLEMIRAFDPGNGFNTTAGSPFHKRQVHHGTSE
jgi:hypothetical protein